TGARINVSAYGSVTTSGATSLSARGFNGASAGVVTISSSTSDVSLLGSVNLSAFDGTGAGNGGMLSVDAPAGSVMLGGTVDVSGQGRGASAGLIQIYSSYDITSGAGKLAARGGYDNQGFSAAGGHIALVSTLGNINLAA